MKKTLLLLILIIAQFISSPLLADECYDVIPGGSQPEPGQAVFDDKIYYRIDSLVCASGEVYCSDVSSYIDGDYYVVFDGPCSTGQDNCPSGYYCYAGVKTYQVTPLCEGEGCNDICTKKEDPVKLGCASMGSSGGVDTGEYFHSQDLLSLSGPPLSASVRLSYRSFARAGSLGTGWRHSYDIALREDGSGNRVLRMGGKERLYTLSGSTYTSEVDDYSTLVDNGDGTYTMTEKSGLVYSFNSSGKCTSITDRNGNQNVLVYNTDGLLETVTDSAGRVLTFAYNTDDRLTSITDPKSQVYTFTQTNHRLTAVTHPDGSSWSYAYDTDGYLVSKTDPENFTVTNTLDTSHRITQSVDPNSRTRFLAYPTDTTPTILSTTFTEKDGNDWTYTYDTVAKVLLSKTDPEGFTTSYTWDSNKNLLSKTEPGGVVTSYTYDGDGNVLTVTNALSRVTTFTYNSFGQILTAVGPRGAIENTYDVNGNLLQVENYDDTVTQFTYNAKGQVTKITDALNRETDFVYYPNGQLQSVTPPSGVTQSFTYDANGNMLTMTAGGLTTTYTYDTMNRVATITDPLNNVTTYTYDGNGNIATVTDAENRTTVYDHNYQDQPTLIQDARGGITTMQYGGNGCTSCTGGADKLTRLTDPADKITTFEYGTTGHLAREIDPLGHMTQYFYEDGRGNLTRRIDANGQTILYSYDNLDRLTQVTLPDSQTISYSYDPVTGDLTSVTSPEIGYSFTHDALGRVTGVTDSRGYGLAYTYNDLGQRTQATLPGGRTATYAYDTGNRLSAITSEAGTFTFGYDARGRRSSLAFPNGITANYGFDNADRLTSLVHAATGGDVLGIAYPQLDGLGNRLQRSEDGQTTSYGYDQLYRLLNASGSQGSENFSYDSVGNRLSGPTVKDTPDVAYDYNDVHQMVKGRKFGYSYDANGNQIARALKNGKGWIQEWDAQNHLTKVERTNGADSRTVTFKYDPFNRRIEKKTVDIFSGVTVTTTTQYVYDAEDIVLQVETIDTGGTPTVTETRFIHGPGIDEPLAMVRAGQTYFYHADGLGSIVALTDQSRNIVQKYGYETFGLPTPTDPAFRQPYAFTAREWDRETGLYFYRARYYDPMEGRFISKDPIGFEGGDFVLYGYVSNNSINLNDPYGLLFGFNAGEKYGESAAMYYAKITIDPCASGTAKIAAWAGGIFASLWTPETSNDTFLTLLPSGAVGKWLGRPFYQYYTKGTQYSGKWLTRGWGWKPPFKSGAKARSGLNLPPYNKANAVQKFSPKWYEPVRGPRHPKPQPQWGWSNSGKGYEYYSGWRWPK